MIGTWQLARFLCQEKGQRALRMVALTLQFDDPKILKLVRYGLSVTIHPLYDDLGIIFDEVLVLVKGTPKQVKAALN